MTNRDLTFGAISVALYERATRKGRRRVSWRPIATAAATVFVSAGSYGVGVWNGRNSESLTFDQAAAIVRDSRMSDEKVTSAAFRLHIIAGHAISSLLAARGRSPSVQLSVDVWLNKLAKLIQETKKK